MKTKLIFYSFLFITIACTEINEEKFRSDYRNSGKYETYPIENPTELWKFKTQGNINASVVADRSKVYFGSGDSCFYALDRKTGDLEWKFKTGGEIYSTAYLKEEYVYFLSYDGFMYKLNAESGLLKWKFKTEGEKRHLIKNYYNPDKMAVDFWDFYQSSPLVYGENIYFGCGNNFYAVNIINGREVWSVETDGAVHSSPAVKDNKIVFGSFDSRVYCLDANTGKQQWVYETGRDTAQYVWLGVQASPAIEDERVYVGSRDALIYCFDLNTGDTLWTNDNFERSWMPSSFAIGDKLYCGSSDGFNFYAINKNNGKIDYTIDTKSYTFSSPAIDNKMAYIGSANGRLYGINLNTEELLWSFTTEGAKSDTLKIYNQTGEMDVERFRMLLQKKEVDNYEELCDFYDLFFKSSGAIVSSPVLFDKILYFGSADGYMYAIKNENSAL